MDTIARLNQIRKDHKVPVKDIAKALDVSKTHAYNLLNQKSEMSVKQLVAACECIGIGLSFTYQ